MKINKWISTFVGVLSVITLQAQVTFILDSIPANTPAGDEIYIAGDFNNWNPGQPEFVLTKNNDGKWAITLEAQSEGKVILFKFTRGSWATVEKGPGGEEIANRSFTFGNGLTKYLTVYNWADHNGSGDSSTAAQNVTVIDEHFYMPQLDRERRIWVYLPPDYDNSSDPYPVLYMHDGQNLFDNQASFAGEWEVDETLNDLAERGLQVPIVVGIDNGGQHRLDEYSPWLNPQYGGGEGEAYMQFIVETLKPFIDENFHTNPDRNSTGLMGSSLGGLISHYGVLQYQDVFSKAGIFSPSYWFSDSVWTFTNLAGMQQNIRFYLMSGALEGEGTVPNMLAMADSLRQSGFVGEDVKTKVVPQGQHNENLWRQEFEEAYLWLFASFALDVPENQSAKPLQLSPNPARKKIRIKLDQNIEVETLEVIDSSGQIVLRTTDFPGRTLDVSRLPAGLYFLRLTTNEHIYTARFVRR